MCVRFLNIIENYTQVLITSEAEVKEFLFQKTAYDLTVFGYTQ